MASSAPLCELNTASAKASTWIVRILHPRRGAQLGARITYGACSKQTVHTFDCFFVGEDPSLYCGGSAKDLNECEIIRLENKFKTETVWVMSSVVFDIRARPQFMSFPHKVVVNVKRTKFAAVQIQSLTLPRTLLPSTRIKQLTQLQETRMQLHETRYLFDIVGFLVAGPINERIFSTKSGAMKCADFRLAQSDENGGEATAIDVFALEPVCDHLAVEVGHCVGVFKVQAKRQGTQSLTCMTTRESFVVRIPSDVGRDINILAVQRGQKRCRSTRDFPRVSEVATLLRSDDAASTCGRTSVARDGGLRSQGWQAETLQYRTDEKMRNQVAAALRLLGGSVQAQMKMDEICARPGASVLRRIFENAFTEQELDMLSAQQMLNALNEFVTEADAGLE